MNKMNDMEPDDDVMDVARKWYLHLEEDAEDTGMLERFDAWINENPAHRTAFNRVVDFWSAIDAMPEIQALRENRALQETASDQPPRPPDNTILAFPPKQLPVPAIGKIPKWQKWAVAAAVILICGLGIKFYSGYLPEGTYQTATGEHRMINLADGSTLFLNTGSRARVEYETDFRRIHLLKGEARFEVARDASRPFIVETTNGRVQAVGTSFNVYDNDTQVEVIVFEGTVAIDHQKNRLKNVAPDDQDTRILSKKAVLVSHGERIAAFENGLSVVRDANDLELSQKKAWQKGQLIFRGQRLSEVVKEMSRYTNRKIIISDEAIGNMKMGGAFDADDFDALLSAIEDAFPVKVIRFTPFIAVLVEA